LNESIPENSKVKILNKHTRQIKLTPFDAQDEPTYFIGFASGDTKKLAIAQLT